jgi:hypothetical protein
MSGVGGSACNRHKAIPRVFVASCDKRVELSECEDYEGAALDAGAGRMGRTLHDSCGFLKGTFQTTPCPEGETLVGSCVVNSEMKRYYSEGPAPFRVDSAQKDCAVAEGRWLGR